jgi:hypothetical protein
VALALPRRAADALPAMLILLFDVLIANFDHLFRYFSHWFWGNTLCRKQTCLDLGDPSL